jgi:polar amino acid transport system substrate-binding protein
MENVLRVGVSTTVPPFAFKESGRIIGLEPELAKEFARFLGRPVRFVDLDLQDQITALLENRTDVIMSGMTITAKRQIKISFSKPYFRTGQMALVHKIHQDDYPAGYYGILGQSIIIRIGVVKGTTGEAFVRNNFGNAKEIVSFKTPEEAVTALLDRRIDIFIHDSPTILILAVKNGRASTLAPLKFLLTEEYIGWGFRKDDTAIITSANRFIDDLKKDGRLDDIVSKWIPYR